MKTEVIVVDDHSPEAFPPLPAPCVVIRRETNGGFGAAVNTGLNAASHDIALVMNSDLRIAPEFVHAFLRDARSRGRAVVSPHVVDEHGLSQWAGRYFPTVAHQATEWLIPLARWRHTRFLHERVGHDTRCTAGAIVEVDWVLGACMCLPVDTVRQIGGFDERFFMNCEEVDLQRRLREVGVPSVFLGTHTVVHRGGGSSASALRRQWLVASRVRYAQKWGGDRRLRLALMACVYVNFLYLVIVRLLGGCSRPLTNLRGERRLAASDGTYQRAVRPTARGGVE
ncbi:MULTISPECIES: glycosyltransferase family 2 protein [Micrococcales]|uniref:glycosyltransferase family 2 protein n=1 Tax=Micrococcales TaxID=85006 RepID=UPI00068D7EC1|nr:MULTISPECIES: glycosyltransferase family 2 protein [Micrococcales]